MRKSFFIAMAAVTIITACQSADKTSPDSVHTPTGDEVKEILGDSSKFTTIQWLDSNYVDYGQMKKGDTKDIAFRFRNTGSYNLVIADVTPGCGCTDPEKPEAPVAPGKEGVIRAKFKSAGQAAGVHVKNITVIANTKPSKRSDLSFRVEVTD